MSINPYRDDDIKTFTIPISGSVVLYGPEIAIVGTPEFQRLAGIRQLGTAYLVYRGATHTRFEHSIGTLHRAEQMIRAVNENPRGTAKIDGRGRRLARLAGLLHDLAHIPFGHTLEDEFGILERHDENKARTKALLQDGTIARILREELGSEPEESEDEYEELLAILEAKSDADVAGLSRPYVVDMIGNTVCADSLDYIERDLDRCGMPGAVGTRFLDYFTITSDNATRPEDRNRMALRLDKRGMPRHDVESEVVKLLSYRYELAERVYFHHAKNSASVMVGRAVVDSGLVPRAPTASEATRYDQNFWWLSDEMLLHAIAKPAIAEALRLNCDPRQPAEIALASDLAERILRRDMYKIAYLAVSDDLQHRSREMWASYGQAIARRTVEDLIAVRSGLLPGQVLVHLPNPKGLTKIAAVRVLTGQDEVLTLEEWDSRHSGRFRSINLAHERLWRITVYMHPDVGPAAEALVRANAMDIFGAPSRYRSDPRRSAYLDEVFTQYGAEQGWPVQSREALEMAASEDMQTLNDAVEIIAQRVKIWLAIRETPTNNEE